MRLFSAVIFSSTVLLSSLSTRIGSAPEKPPGAQSIFGFRDATAQNAAEVQEAAQQTAAYGASLAAKAGFRSESMAVEAAPTWKGIIKTAEEYQASLIVLGSHRRSGRMERLLGSVAAAVVTHSATSVLVVHQRS